MYINNPFPVPTAGSKHKADDLGMGDNDHQAKWQRTLTPVAMSDGNLPLKKTWEMTELKNRRGLLAKFRVGPLSCHPMSILTLKGTHSTCYGQKTGAIGQLGRPNLEVKRQSQENGELDLMCVHLSLFSSFPGPGHLERKAI